MLALCDCSFVLNHYNKPNPPRLAWFTILFAGPTFLKRQWSLQSDEAPVSYFPASSTKLTVIGVLVKDVSHNPPPPPAPLSAAPPPQAARVSKPSGDSLGFISLGSIKPINRAADRIY